MGGDNHGLTTTVDEFMSYWPERHVDGALEDRAPDHRLVGNRKDPATSALMDARWNNVVGWLEDDDRDGRWDDVGPAAQPLLEK